MSVEHPNLEILKFSVSYDDGTSYEVQVKGTQSIHITIPENTTYQFTIHFIVKGKTLKKLWYKQEAKAWGMVVRKREVQIGDEFEPREEPYQVTFEKDTTPSGRVLRGDYNCTSSYYAGDELLFVAPWKLTVESK